MCLNDFNIQGVLSKYPSLRISKNINNEIVVEGHLHFDITHNDTHIIDSYEIEILISDNYPNEIPIVREIGGRILKKFEHIYPDRSLCLATEANIHSELSPRYDMVDFVDKFIIPYLFSYSYFEKYKTVPYGERSHGKEGVLEFYLDYFNVDTYHAVYNLLEYTCNKVYRGHNLCPCGSEQRIRNCHMKSVLKLKEKCIVGVLKKELAMIKKKRGNY